MKILFSRLLQFTNTSRPPQLSEDPTAEEREAFIIYTIDQVFKNNFSQHKKVKNEIVDHFIEAIESQDNTPTRAKFMLQFDDIYRSFGKATGIRKIAYDRIKNHQMVDHEIPKPFLFADINVVSILIGVNSPSMLEPSLGMNNFNAYTSCIALTILLIKIIVDLFIFLFDKTSSICNKKQMQALINNSKWTLAGLCLAIIYFMVDIPILGASAIAFISLMVSYYSWRKYFINHLKNKKKQQVNS